MARSYTGQLGAGKMQQHKRCVFPLRRFDVRRRRALPPPPSRRMHTHSPTPPETRRAAPSSHPRKTCQRVAPHHRLHATSSHPNARPLPAKLLTFTNPALLLLGGCMLFLQWIKLHED